MERIPGIRKQTIRVVKYGLGGIVANREGTSNKISLGFS